MLHILSTIFFAFLDFSKLFWCDLVSLLKVPKKVYKKPYFIQYGCSIKHRNSEHMVNFSHFKELQWMLNAFVFMIM